MKWNVEIGSRKLATWYAISNEKHHDVTIPLNVVNSLCLQKLKSVKNCSKKVDGDDNMNRGEDLGSNDMDLKVSKMSLHCSKAITVFC